MSNRNRKKHLHMVGIQEPVNNYYNARLTNFVCKRLCCINGTILETRHETMP